MLRLLPYKKILSIILILSFVVPASLLTAPQKSEAIFGIGDITFDPSNFVQSTITATKSTLSAIYQYTLNYKELTLDGIAWYVAKLIIREMTTSIVNWINSGFDGNPSFITDPAGMFIDIANQEIGSFIEGSSDLNFLCSPFSIDVRLSLAFRYRPFKKKITCTFTDVIKNAKNAGDSFVKGNFDQGGWNNWLSLTTEPQNNAVGASILAEEELAVRIANKQQSKKAEVDWGKGFLSWKKCTVYASNDENSANFLGPRQAGTNVNESGFIGPRPVDNAQPGKNTACAHEEIQTPGTVIESGLENVMGSGIRQLELADEFNEIVNALFAQMIKVVITSAGGLKGSSGGGTYDGSAYINQISQQTAPEESAVLVNIKNDSTNGINTSIAEETSYYTQRKATLDKVNATKAAFVAVQACYQQKITTPQVPALTSYQVSIAQARIKEAGDIITQSINPVAVPLANDIESSNNLIIQLNKFKTAIQAAKTVNETSTSTAAYSKFIGDRVLHDTVAVSVAANENETSSQGTPTIATQMASLKSQADVKLSQCGVFPAGVSGSVN